eukprot:c22897_g1_i1 orf=469-2214(-)
MAGRSSRALLRVAAKPQGVFGIVQIGNRTPGLQFGIVSTLNKCNVDGQELCLFNQRAFLSTPRITLKRDPGLEAAMEMDKKIRPVIRIRDVVLKSQTGSIPVKHLESMKRQLAINVRVAKVKTFMKMFPNIFELSVHPQENIPYCKLTKEAVELTEEEQKIYAEQEPVAVEKLRKLLMMSAERKIRVDKLEQARRDFGFPVDFLTRIVPSYPDFFRIVQPEGEEHEFLELVMWDESLALSEFEKKAKEDARQTGVGEIETRGRPLAFKVSYSPGMALKRKNLEVLEQWQQLPYVSPYEDGSWVKSGTLQADKRAVAVLHELLCLTVEKKAQLNVIAHFRTDYKLSQKFANLVTRFPGIFYLSLKGRTRTAMLREGYIKSELVEANPLVELKVKYIKMVNDGPRMRTALKKAKKEEGLAKTSSEPDSQDREATEKDDDRTEELPCKLDEEGTEKGDGGNEETSAEGSPGGTDSESELEGGEEVASQKAEIEEGRVEASSELGSHDTEVTEKEDDRDKELPCKYDDEGTEKGDVGNEETSEFSGGEDDSESEMEGGEEVAGQNGLGCETEDEEEKSTSESALK